MSTVEMSACACAKEAFCKGKAVRGRHIRLEYKLLTYMNGNIVKGSVRAVKQIVVTPNSTVFMSQISFIENGYTKLIKPPSQSK